MKEDWANKMKHKLEGHQKSAPEGLWEDICEQMGFDAELVGVDAELVGVDRKLADAAKESEGLGKKRGRSIGLWTAAAVLLALVGFFAFYRLGSSVEESKTAVGKMPVVERNAVVEKDSVVEKNSDVERIAVVERNQLAERVSVESGGTIGKGLANRSVKNVSVAGNSGELSESATSTPAAPVASVPTEPTSSSPFELEAANQVELAEQKTSEVSDTADTESPASAESTPVVPVYHDVPLLGKEQPRHKMKNESKWSVGLNASGGLLAANSSGNTRYDYTYYDPIAQNSAQGSYDKSWSSVQVVEKYVWKHSVPIRAGLSVGYQLTPRLSLLSGISYTCLYSRMEFQPGTWSGNRKTTEQWLNYLGIPLGLGYQVLGDGHRYRLYVSGNVLAEKNLSKSPWQLSVNAGVGAEYILSRLIGVYLEPSLGYYFDDGSSLEHYYKKHPLAPSIEFGVRMHVGE